MRRVYFLVVFVALFGLLFIGCTDATNNVVGVSPTPTTTVQPTVTTITPVLPITQGNGKPVVDGITIPATGSVIVNVTSTVVSGDISPSFRAGVAPIMSYVDRNRRQVPTEGMSENEIQASVDLGELIPVTTFVPVHLHGYNPVDQFEITFARVDPRFRPPFVVGYVAFLARRTMIPSIEMEIPARSSFYAMTDVADIIQMKVIKLRVNIDPNAQ